MGKTLKMINVDELKWDAFKLWCIDNRTTMTAEIDKWLTKRNKEVS